jgi:hypothetical protein
LGSLSFFLLSIDQAGERLSDAEITQTDREKERERKREKEREKERERERKREREREKRKDMKREEISASFPLSYFILAASH